MLSRPESLDYRDEIEDPYLNPDQLDENFIEDDEEFEAAPIDRRNTLKDAYGIYLQEQSKFPLLSADQEKMLFAARDCGSALEVVYHSPSFQETIPPKLKGKFDNAFYESRSTRDFIAITNQRLVISVARQHWSSLSLPDRVQEGHKGLLRAIDLFKVDKGFRFSTYATWWIRQAIDRGTVETGRHIRFPVHIEEHLVTIQNAIRQFRQKNFREPTPKEIKNNFISSLSCSDEMKKNLFYILITSMATPLFTLDKKTDEEGDTTVGELIPSNDQYSDEVVEEVLELERPDVLMRALNKLPERKKAILMMRYGLMTGKEMTLDEIGDNFGLTRERIRQIEQEALRDLKYDTSLRGYWKPNGETSSTPENSNTQNIKISNGRTIDTTLITPSFGKIVISTARENPDVWNQLTSLERSVAGVYYRTRNYRLTEHRLAKILQMEPDEVKNLAASTVSRLIRLLDQS